MRLLLICPTAFDPRPLHELCGCHEVQTLVDADFDANSDIQNIDAIVLAGQNRPSGATDDVLAHALQQKGYGSTKPADGVDKLPLLIGMGWGFAVVCALYNERLDDTTDRGEAASILRPSDDGARLFQGTEPIKVVPNERWYADQLPKQLAVLAISDSGIEAIRHKKQLVYGLQLLPADFVYQSDGKLVFDNLLAMARKRPA